MTTRGIRLPGPLGLVPTERSWDSFGTTVPHLEVFLREINQLAADGGIPATVESWKSSLSLAVYTDTAVARLRPTRYGDAYQLTSARPRSIRDHAKLSRHALLIQVAPQPWKLFTELRQLPQRPPLKSHWDFVLAEWEKAVGPSVPQADLRASRPRHDQFLDDLTDIVDKSLEVELARATSLEPAVYRAVVSARERLSSRRSVYEFVVVRPERVRFSLQTYVYVTSAPHLRGRVIAINEDRVVVRFETTVDYGEIPQRGELSEQTTSRVHQTQLDAIDRVRRGKSLNHRILPALVDREYLPYRPAQARKSRLDQHQHDVVGRALATPDFLLVLGPPGTGKTSTIKVLIDELARKGKRVLLASHTNRAVDNVLERLSPQIRAVRVGNEDSLTNAARSYLPDEQVHALKDEILANTAGWSARLESVVGEGALGRLVEHLAMVVDNAGRATAELTRHRLAYTRAAERVRAPWMPHLVAAEASQAATLDAVKGAEHHALDLSHRLDRLAQHAAIIRAVLVPRGRWLRRRQRQANDLWEAARQLHNHAVSDRNDLLARVNAQQAEDSEIRRLTQEGQGCQAMINTRLLEAAEVHQRVADLLKNLDIQRSPITSLADWTTRVEDLRALLGRLDRSRDLLRDWRDGVAHAGDDLQRELLAYANVVAATCIGTATSTLLAELEFDVAIIDEAGQISLPNLLVPLVRARRAILVGDHHQLPPFLDDDVRKWSEGLRDTSGAPPEVANQLPQLVTRSGFEIMYEGADEQHRSMLRTQRRMPAQIGDFVSAAFYDRLLNTDHPGASPSRLFASPFAMITTSDRPLAHRGEVSERDGGSATAGYRNPCEADLIAELIERQAGEYADWAVIVPYRAQVDLIRAKLADRLGDAVQVSEQVGTVDSFQGGERDFIVYGFTRSNSAGTVGFLRELRRLNVAISRAKRQLVLVGDLDMLVRSHDDGFGAMARRMSAYLDQAGDLCRSRDVEQRLTDLTQEC